MGLFTVTNAGGSTVTGGGSNSLTIGGTLTQVNTALSTLTDTDGTAGPDSITLNAKDQFNVAAGTQTIAVTTNGLPSITAPTTATVAQNVATSVSGVSVSESGNTTTSGETFTAMLADTNGVLSASAAGGASVSSSGTTLTISGSLSQVDAALLTLTDSDGTTPSDSISVNAKDSFGNTATQKTIAVTVTGSGPQLSGQITLSVPAEGTLVPSNAPVATFTDTTSSDTSGDFTASIDWGDGTTSTGTVSGASGSFTVLAGGVGHTYADEGLVVLGVTITDTLDSATLSLTSSQTVADADVLTGNPITFTANPNTAFNGTVATFSDAYTGNTASDFTATINWGDGTAATVGTVTGSGATFTVSGGHTYATDGDYQVAVTMSDDAPGTATATADSTADVTSQLSGLITLSVPAEGTLVPSNAPVATFTDTTSSDTSGDFTASIDWGDGTTSTGTVSGASGSFTVLAGGVGHIYADEGLVVLGVTITDTLDSATLSLTSSQTVADADVLTGNPITFTANPVTAFNGTVATFSDAYTGNTASDFTATINWGDGTGCHGRDGHRVGRHVHRVGRAYLRGRRRLPGRGDAERRRSGHGDRDSGQHG